MRITVSDEERINTSPFSYLHIVLGITDIKSRVRGNSDFLLGSQGWFWNRLSASCAGTVSDGLKIIT